MYWVWMKNTAVIHNRQKEINNQCSEISMYWSNTSTDTNKFKTVKKEIHTQCWETSTQKKEIVTQLNALGRLERSENRNRQVCDIMSLSRGNGTQYHHTNQQCMEILRTDTLALKPQTG
jgi:F0F1-type ATP synthase membrane subunit b/b'